MSTLNLDLPAEEQEEPLAPDTVEQIFNPSTAEDLRDPEPEVEASADEVDEADEVEAAPEKDDEPRSQKRIRQEIERRKALEDRNRQLEQQQQVLEQRFHQLMERMQAPKPAEPEIPEFEEDPAAHLLAQQRKLAEQVQQTQQLTQQQVAAQQHAQQLAAVQQRFDAVEQQFAQQHPDYYQRVEQLKQQRMQMWQQLGHQPAEAMQRVQQEAWQLVMDGLRAGSNPAEVIYGMTAPVAAAAEPPRQARVSSLGSRSKGSNSSRLPTASELAAMSEEEFAKATAGDNWRKIAGG